MAQLIACPECRKHLHVPDDLVGTLVQCPECKQTFTASSPDEPASSTGTTATPPPVKIAPTPWESKKPDADKEKSKPPAKKKRRDDDDEDGSDDIDLRRARRAPRRSLTPHRGEMILVFGIVALVMAVPIVSFVLGLMAWIMGTSDLREIREGRMDPSGEGPTSAGRVMGMISVILHIIGFVGCCGFYGFIFALAGLGAAAAPRNPAPKFR